MSEILFPMEHSERNPGKSHHENKLFEVYLRPTYGRFGTPYPLFRRPHIWFVIRSHAISLPYSLEMGKRRGLMALAAAKPIDITNRQSEVRLIKETQRETNRVQPLTDCKRPSFRSGKACHVDFDISCNITA
ncbi:hypothetical protein CRM22_007378 [Opisthorchis felineus]|uniref:Uncharacterized protein n=1 Tax=Opisthorchis felineus TaxID=147828 RepID=A0A4S2LP02_OPIFE|nr:hypothetical protein CRM22_007378 [Opisthorchis felineus]